MNIYISIVLSLFFILYILWSNVSTRDIYIFIGNSFKNFYHLPVNPLICKCNKILYKCYYSQTKKVRYHASLYNGNRHFPSSPNYSYNIIITTEKLSQVKFMKKVGEGNYKNYHLAVDYRLFLNRYHLSRNIYSYYNISQFVQIARNNFCNFSSFISRKNYVYIQRVHYKNRQYLVKEIMKHLNVDSYGNDLNNRKWPINISVNNKIDLLKNYKFCIAIENSVITWKNGTKYEADVINNDYVTEKLTDCFLAGCIPIYFGPQNIDLFLPHSDSIINFSKFSTIYDLVQYLKDITINTSKLKKHLRWYYNNISYEWYNRFNNIYTFDYCKICNKAKNYYMKKK